MSKILVGVSGGVDSSLAAAMLLEGGHEVAGGTLTLFDSRDPLYGGRENTDLADAAAVCERLSIEHRVIDLSDDFRREVIGNFVSQYLSGATPNPCVVCNKKIKFGAMLDAAISLGYQKVATGHYARIVECDGRFLLYRAADSAKDQSYMLYSLSQTQLSRAVFPLGDLTKSQVREMAEQRALLTSRKKDSQDICFIPSGDYATFLEQLTGEKSPAGEFCDPCGNVLGTHSGIIRYTEGQRKGLGIALGQPMYVISKSAETNRVVLGDEQALFCRRVYVGNVNFIPFDTLEQPIEVTAKLRYRHTAQKATLYPYKNGALLEFSEPQRAPTVGQSAVFYDGDLVLGGGIILRAE